MQIPENVRRCLKKVYERGNMSTYDSDAVITEMGNMDKSAALWLTAHKGEYVKIVEVVLYGESTWLND